MRKYFAALCLWGLLTGAAAALSDPEYREMMKEPEFAAADRALNEAWAEAKRSMPKSEFEELRKRQRDWNARGRDAEARGLMDEGGMAALRAYAEVTNSRADHIREALDVALLKALPEGAPGYYVRKGESGEADGWLKVRRRDRSELEAEVEAVLVLGPDNVRSGALSGRGDLKDGIAEIVDPEDQEGRMIVTFEGDQATVATSDAFKESGWCGMGVLLDGTYVRQKLRR